METLFGLLDQEPEPSAPHRGHWLFDHIHPRLDRNEHGDFLMNAMRLGRV